MHRVLFVCTANIFRSRFSEEVYNHLIVKEQISSTAFSAGLKVGAYITRTIYKPALDELIQLRIKPLRKNDFSVHINELELSKYNRIICLDELEHKPMVQSNHKLRDMNIEYWNIVDEPKVSSDVSLPQCYERVKNLVSQLSVELS